MGRATTIKEALKKWEAKTQKVATEATDIQLQFQWEPIEKMDNTLSTLKNCEKLSLSTNAIEKITGIGGMKNLKILSLGRNEIKSLIGIELAENLEELWISYNQIEILKGIEKLQKLKVFYVGNNLIKDWSEFNRLTSLPVLQELLFLGNPLCENMEEVAYTAEVILRLPRLKTLDGKPVIRNI